MRRFVAILLLAAGFTLTSCGSPAEPSSAPSLEATPSPPPPSAPQPPYPVRRSPVSVSLADGSRIGGFLYRPDGPEKVPLVVCSHGLGSHYQSMQPWAEQLSRLGLAAFCFDFRGTGSTLSTGDPTEMSVLTETQDILQLLDAAAGWDGIDAERIVLFGESQGGMASAVAAGRAPDKVAGLVLLYPAFVIPDHVRLYFPDPGDIPEVSGEYLWVTVGRRYVTDVYDYDAFSEIGGFTKPVLIMHGTEDELVPLSYSEQAARVYPDAQLEIIGGAGHGFGPADAQTAFRFMTAYLERIGILPAA